MEKTKNKYVGRLVMLCSMLYFISYITRINYAAILVEITKNLNITKTAASLALTASAVSYGFGQLISGYLGDRIKPDKIIVSGLVCTAAMNLLMPMASSPAYMTAIWFVNGFAQAMMWPPIVKIMTSMLTADEYKRGCVKVSCASSVATIFIYIAAPFIIHVAGWRYVFVFSAVCAVLMCVLWIFGYKKVKENLSFTGKIHTEESTEKEKFTPKIFFLLVAILFSIIVQGSLRDGVANWMPSYISETFNLGSEISILTSVLLPIFSIFTFNIVSIVNLKFIKNEYSCVTLFYSLGAVSALILALFGSKSAAAAVFAAGILNAAMHGVNYCQTGLTPVYFARYGKVSFISGILNSGTYIGSAVSTYGIAALTKSLAWDKIALLWCVTSVFGAVFCLFISKAWKKFKS